MTGAQHEPRAGTLHLRSNGDQYRQSWDLTKLRLLEDRATVDDPRRIKAGSLELNTIPLARGRSNRAERRYAVQNW
jgi:hypothetical protein